MSLHYQNNAAPNVYFDRTFNLEASKIIPGEYYVTKRDMILVTVLGSCVAACIRDRATGIGGMNHFMLPENVDKSNPMLSNSARYGAYAMEVMINQMLKQGARRENLEAKIFGGASVIEGFKSSNVGNENVRFTLNYLQKEKIPIVAQDLLGMRSRKVYFFPQTGRVLVKKLAELPNETVMERELAYKKRLRESKIDGAIDIFN